MYQQAVVCGENLHNYSTEKLNLPPDEYLSKVWSPSVKDYLKLGIGDFSKEFEVYESVSQPISTYHELKWNYRGDDEFYCLDIFDKDWRLLHQAVACGEGLHQFSPRNLNLAPGEYHWKVWSPSVTNYHEAQPGLEGDFTAGECGLPYRSDEYWVQWGCRNQDLLYCIDIYDEDGQPIAKPYHCAEYLHQFSPRALDNLGISEPEKYRWKVWSPSVTNYDDPQPEFEGEFYFEPPKPITPAMNVSWEVLRAHEISSLHIDDEGILWLGTTGGLEKWQLAPTQQLLASWHRTSNGFPANQINAIAPGANNSLWLATDQGLVNFREGTVFKHFTSDNSLLPTQNVRTVEADGKGGIWISTGKLFDVVHLMHFDGFSQWQTIEFPKSISDKYSFSNLTSIANDKQGGFWIHLLQEPCLHVCRGDIMAGILHYDSQENWNNRHYLDLGKPINELITDEQGTLWTTFTHSQYSSEKRLAHYDGQNWEKIASIPSEIDWVNIKLLAVTKQGLLVGSNQSMYSGSKRFRKLYLYDKQNQWHTFELDDKWPFPHVPDDITGLGDRLWVNSLTYFNGTTWQYTGSQYNSHRPPLNIDPSTGRLWSTLRGLLMYETGKGNLETLPYITNASIDNKMSIRQHLPTHNGTHFLVSNDSVIYMDSRRNWQTIPTPDGEPIRNLIFATDQQGGLWMAGERKLSYFHFNGAIQEYSLAHLPQENISYLFYNDQKLWIGMKQSLANFDGQNWQTFNLQSILEDKGYQFDSYGSSTEVGKVNGVLTIASDNAGGIWLGINGLFSLLHFDGQATWTYFNDNQMPMGNRSYITQLYNDGYSQLWIASSNGLIRMRFE